MCAAPTGRAVSAPRERSDERPLLGDPPLQSRRAAVMASREASVSAGTSQTAAFPFGALPSSARGALLEDLDHLKLAEMRGLCERRDRTRSLLRFAEAGPGREFG